MTSELVQGILFIIMMLGVFLIVLFVCASCTWEVTHEGESQFKVMKYWIIEIFKWLWKG